MNLTAATLVKVTGTDLDEPQGLLFSHPGLKAEYVESGVADVKLKGKAKQNATAHTFRITATSDVLPGIYDVRVVGQWGISNPRAFAVGRLPEVEEREPNNDVAEAHRVPVDVTVNGVFSTGTDVDYFFSTPERGSGSFWRAHPPRSTAEQCRWWKSSIRSDAVLRRIATTRTMMPSPT
jgi:hypothetical protein